MTHSSHKKIFLSVVLKNIREAVDPRNFIHIPAELIRYGRDLCRFRGTYRSPYPVRLLPVFFERSGMEKHFDPHYIYQAFWATRRIFSEKCPRFHVDVSSHLSFVVQLAGAMTVFQVEFHPAGVKNENFREIRGDLLNLPFGDRSIDSLSCLHVVEHIGLGRYGDRIDPEGSIKAARELERVLKPGGKLYLSAPVGHERVCFNAHRVFSPKSIQEMFPSLALTEFSWVDDQNCFKEHQELESANDFNYGCGMFEFEKPKSVLV